jgi:hypothetical protein
MNNDRFDASTELGPSRSTCNVFSFHHQMMMMLFQIIIMNNDRFDASSKLDVDDGAIIDSCLGRRPQDEEQGGRVKFTHPVCFQMRRCPMTGRLWSPI